MRLALKVWLIKKLIGNNVSTISRMWWSNDWIMIDYYGQVWLIKSTGDRELPVRISLIMK